jgi:hypothetical protein
MVPTPSGVEVLALGMVGRFVNGGTTGSCGEDGFASTNGGSVLGGVVSGTGSGRRIGGSTVVVVVVGITSGGGPGIVTGRTGVGIVFDGTGTVTPPTSTVEVFAPGERAGGITETGTGAVARGEVGFGLGFEVLLSSATGAGFEVIGSARGDALCEATQRSSGLTGSFARAAANDS